MLCIHSRKHKEREREREIAYLRVRGTSVQIEGQDDGAEEQIIIRRGIYYYCTLGDDDVDAMSPVRVVEAYARE